MIDTQVCRGDAMMEKRTTLTSTGDLPCAILSVQLNIKPIDVYVMPSVSLHSCKKRQ